MSKIVWDKAGEHIYETGVDHGVLYPTVGGVYGKGVAWNGLTAVNESPSGAESTAQWADNIKYLNLISAEEFSATVEAFTYPDEFAVCDGSAEPVPGVMIGQQNRPTFGLSYRTLVGNDLLATEYGYKIHLIYGATASPSERAYSTVNDSPEALSFSWELTTTPVTVTGYKSTASLTVDSTKVSAANMAKLENILYGTETEDARLPMPDEVIALLGSSNAITLTVVGADTTAEVKGASVSTLQERIVVEDTAITGRLLYVENFTGYSTDTAKQEGNFIALNVSASMEGADISGQVLGGTTEVAQTPDTNGNMVFRISNADAQSIRITATKGKDSTTKVYNLSGLELVDASSLG